MLQFSASVDDILSISSGLKCVADHVCMEQTSSVCPVGLGKHQQWSLCSAHNDSSIWLKGLRGLYAYTISHHTLIYNHCTGRCTLLAHERACTLITHALMIQPSPGRSCSFLIFFFQGLRWDINCSWVCISEHIWLCVHSRVCVCLRVWCVRFMRVMTLESWPWSQIHLVLPPLFWERTTATSFVWTRKTSTGYSGWADER